MAVNSEPYFWMGPGRGGRNAWLEFPAATSHAALVEVAERLRRDFGAVVIERFPEGATEDSREYWWLRIDSATLMLMRNNSVGLSVESGDVGLLVQIGRAWGVQRFVGWRWKLWRAWRRLAGRDA